jgi:hypothetical protein
MRRRRTVLAIVGIVTGALVLLTFFALREPPAPYEFLRKFKVVETRLEPDRIHRAAILEADFDDVWAEIEKEFKGRQVMVGETSNSYNGVSSRGKLLATQDRGVVRLSDNLNWEFKELMSPPNVQPGRCVVVYTRPPSWFDRATEWIRNLFGGKREPASWTFESQSYSI